MFSASEAEPKLLALVRPWFGGPIVRWIALLGLCAAYLQGGINKTTDFAGAIAEISHFGLSPPALIAAMTTVVELAAALLILTGFYRWMGAFALAGFTLMATFIANRFWEMAPHERFMAANGFLEHLGLLGGLHLVAWHGIREKSRSGQIEPS
jgi:uncharacterized membrane protein YphA (DoxX/SURF4 family)